MDTWTRTDGDDVERVAATCTPRLPASKKTRWIKTQVRRNPKRFKRKTRELFINVFSFTGLVENTAVRVVRLAGVLNIADD